VTADASDPLQLGQRVVAILETGLRTATYKLATLMALIDHCIETCLSNPTISYQCRFPIWPIACWRPTGCTCAHSTATNCANPRSHAREFLLLRMRYVMQLRSNAVLCQSPSQSSAHLPHTEARSMRSRFALRSNHYTGYRNCQAYRQVPLRRFFPPRPRVAVDPAHAWRCHRTQTRCGTWSREARRATQTSTVDHVGGRRPQYEQVPTCGYPRCRRPSVRP
jgi:hypothetical protein